jgi:poly(A) polymerase
VRSPVLESVRAVAPVPGAWLVGGSVRDMLLGRPVVDVDLLVDGDPRRAARAVAAHVGGAVFPLSERHGAWRVVADSRTVDVARARGSVEDDLYERDFTVNAIAVALDDGRMLDPTGGRADLDARVLRAVSERIFRDDALRLLRLGRLAHELRFAIDPDTARLAQAEAELATRPSGERVYMEVRRVLACDDPADGLRRLAELAVLDVVLPELQPLRGVEQSPFHHLDAYEHTLQVVDTVADVGDEPGHYLWRHERAMANALARPVGDGMPGRVAVRLAALLHDVAKPQTRTVFPDGRIGFPGHDVDGARMAARVLRRWRAAGATIRYCCTLVREHLRLGFLVHHRPLDRRDAFRYARATAPWVEDSIVLSLADRLATRGTRARQRFVRAHAETAAELLDLHLALARQSPPPLLRGDEIAAATGARGPAIARLVEALAEEQAAGAVATREDALRFVRAGAAEADAEEPS